MIEIPIGTVLPADSPRSAGSSSTHAQLLAETGAELPPILVHRQTMRVIDGMHRLEAAKIRADRTIRARFFDGDTEEAFVLAVETNVRHGLPLSLADRKAAALRIVQAHPHWSDRAVAAKAGLTHKTVGALRRQSTGEIPQSTARIGLDGRTRPVRTARAAGSGADGRDGPRGAEDLPEARDGQSTPPCRFLNITQRTSAAEGRAAARQSVPVMDRSLDWKASLQRLRSDPSLRYTEAGRTLLRLLEVHVVTAAHWQIIAEQVPAHCLEVLTDFALNCAEDLQRLSIRLEQRRKESL
ncbi:ParB N-terminal domain-containing protein [Streptomyces sp. NPDC031705]|uniref:ParB/RepB/Spo0J family partition protein n=1 Tax=Streptomyces sp. NPDC031705 TaxID=3155729 RepID=UPI0033EFF8A4